MPITQNDVQNVIEQTTKNKEEQLELLLTLTTAIYETDTEIKEENDKQRLEDIKSRFNN